MADKEEMLSEIHNLIGQQLEALRGKLPVEDVALYAQRKRRIDELLKQIGKGGR